MYLKDKTNRITLRLSDEQMEFVQASAELYEVSPSEFLRMVINVTMASGARRENEQTSKHDQL